MDINQTEMDNQSAQSPLSELPPLPRSVEIVILALFGIGHALVVLCFLANFPLELQLVFKHLSRLPNLRWRRKKEEHSDAEHGHRDSHSAKGIVGETSTSKLKSPASTRFRNTFHSSADEDAAWSTSVSPFPVITPTPIRRYLSSSSPDRYTPSIYSPQPPAGQFPITTPNFLATPTYDHYLSPSVYAPSPLELRKRRKFIPERPHRNYDLTREFEVITPESQRAETVSYTHLTLPTKRIV